MDSVSVSAALIAGVLTFLSPCIIPLLPSYLSYISGETIENIKNGRGKAIFNTALGSIFFGLGFSAAFVLLGYLASQAIEYFQDYKSIIMKVLSVLVFLFGLHLLGVFKIKFLMRTSTINTNKINKKNLFIRASLMGLTFALGWIPCAGPVLTSIIILAASKETSTDSIALLSIFSLGLWIPMFITGLFAGFILDKMKNATKLLRYVEIASGVILIIISISIMFGYFELLTVYLETF